MNGLKETLKNNLNKMDVSFLSDVIATITEGALYTYEFDVTDGIVEQDIISNKGVNVSAALGLVPPF